MRNVVGVLQQLQSQGHKAIPADIWKQVLVLLLEQLHQKRRTAPIEEALPDRLLHFLIEILPRAMPDFESLCPAFNVPEVMANVLQQPGLRESIDQKVLRRLPALSQHDDQGEDGGSCEHYNEAFVTLSTIVMQAALTEALTSRSSAAMCRSSPPPQSVASMAGQAKGRPASTYPGPSQLGIGIGADLQHMLEPLSPPPPHNFRQPHKKQSKQGQDQQQQQDAQQAMLLEAFRGACRGGNNSSQGAASDSCAASSASDLPQDMPSSHSPMLGAPGMNGSWETSSTASTVRMQAKLDSVNTPKLGVGASPSASSRWENAMGF